MSWILTFLAERHAQRERAGPAGPLRLGERLCHAPPIVGADDGSTFVRVIGMGSFGSLSIGGLVTVHLSPPRLPLLTVPPLFPPAGIQPPRIPPTQPLVWTGLP